jgi:hypothetical protein
VLSGDKFQRGKSIFSALPEESTLFSQHVSATSTAVESAKLVNKELIAKDIVIPEYPAKINNNSERSEKKTSGLR